jgi:ABC-type transport system involved in multi-copper enzyme maturation permease subunit
MTWTITKKDFLLNLMTFKFAVGTIVCVVLTAVFMPVLVNDYQLRLQEYNENVTNTQADLRTAKVYMNICMGGRYMVHRPPAILSVFSKGVENQLASSVKIETNTVPGLSAHSSEVNPYLSVLPTMDISLIFKIIVSVLALLVACDVISGEREQGTLKLILSGTVARHQVLLGKMLAGQLTLLVPLAISFLVGLSMLLFSPMVDLTASDWARISLIYIASVIFVSTIYNIGLFVSTLTRRSAISLIAGLFFWIVFIMVVPNVAVYFATQIAPLEPEEKVNSQTELINQKMQAEVGKVRRGIPGTGSNEVSDFYEKSLFYILVCDKKGMEWRQKYHAALSPLYINYADKLWQIEHLHFKSLLQQKQLANNFSRISPISMYDHIMSILTETDTASCQYFIDRARTHREEVIDYLRLKTDNFSSASYFTQCTEADMAKYQEYLDGKMLEDDFQKWKEKKIAQMIPLDLRDFPQFIYQPSVAKSSSRTIPDLMLLFFANVLFFALSFVTFLKYDIT